MWIVQSKNSGRKYDTVVAPPGYYRTREGKMVRDKAPSPEMGPKQNAYMFSTHMAAARVAGTLADPIIREV